MQPQTPSSQPIGFAALRRDFWLKAAFGMPCIVVFSGIFKWLQLYPQSEPLMWDWCPFWDLIPFHTAWTWPYLALFPLIGVAWMMQPGWREMLRFFGAMLAAGAVAWSSFLLWPTGSVRPALTEIPWYYQALIAADAPLNSIPCLHAAFSVVATTALLHGALRAARGWRIVGWLFVAMICLAAIALRQHSDFDVLGGLVLGGVSAWGYRRSFVRDVETAAEPESEIEGVAEVPARD